MEKWRAIKGWEGAYEVSDRGRVRSIERMRASKTPAGMPCEQKVKPRVLKQRRKRNGYMSVCLSRDGRHWYPNVHRLVADAFLPPHGDAEVVNHLNLNRADNRAENLEWCTQRDNIQHAIRAGVRPPAWNKKPVLCVETGISYPSSYEAAMELNLREYANSKDTIGIARKIRACVLGYNKTAYGFHWKDVSTEPSTTIPKGSTPKRAEMGCPS